MDQESEKLSWAIEWQDQWAVLICAYDSGSLTIASDLDTYAKINISSREHLLAVIAALTEAGEVAFGSEPVDLNAKT